MLELEDSWPWASWRAGYLSHCQGVWACWDKSPGHCPLLLPSFPVTEEPGASRKMRTGAGCCQNSTTPQPVSSQGSPAVVLTAAARAVHGNGEGFCGKPWISYSCTEQPCLDIPRDFGEVRERRSWHTADLCPGRRVPALPCWDVEWCSVACSLRRRCSAALSVCGRRCVPIPML